MEAGEAGGEDSRDLLLFRSDFSGFEQLEPRDGWVHMEWSVVSIN